MKSFSLIFILFFAQVSIWSQDYLVDTSDFYQLSGFERELIQEFVPKIKNEVSDSVKLELIHELYMQFNDNDVWVEYCQLMLPILESYSKKRGKNEYYLKTLHGVYNDMAYYYGYKSDLKNEAVYNEKAYLIAEELGDNSKLGYSLNALANSYYEIGKFDKAIELFDKGIKAFRSQHDTNGVMVLIGNQALMYYEQAQYQSAIELYEEAAFLAEAYGSKSSLAQQLANWSLVYHAQDDYEMAKKFLDSAMAIRYELGDMPGYYQALNNMAKIYIDEGKYQVALDTVRSIIQGRKKLKLWAPLSYSYNTMAALFLRTDQVDSALIYARRSMELSRQINLPAYLKDASLQLYKSYEKLNNGDSAFKYLKLHVEMKDSLFNQENLQAAIKNKLSNDFEKKSAADSVAHAKKQEVKQAKIDQQQAEIKAKNTLQYGLIGGLLLVIIFAAFMYNRYKLTQKQKVIIQKQKDVVEEQKKIVERQKDLVEEKNREITDSINYAKRIQEAILPSRYSLVDNLSNGFVLFKPKDVVSGDFYWLETKDDSVFFAVADCTGHGVPGAMVSVVCSNALSKSLLEDQITDPGRLLDRTRELIIRRFAKSGEDVKDGMDISLCKLTNDKLQWSGANNPLWIIRNGSEEIEETKANKQPVGLFATPAPFNTHEFDLNKGDTIYIFSDGYPDQFGGEKGKKLKTGNFKNLLLQNNHLEMDQIKSNLEKFFVDWRGDFEQVDDVCIIGVRV